ncbi:MAG: hypothetical protein L6R39_001578 [Caloplaca ligustica]|nr:MAG: hypothetical protein L6R39_001578 [Caloplaca ligustica]
MSQKEWRQIRIELQSVGITAAQFNNSREKILGMLSDAFQEDVEEDSPIMIKKAGQLTRLLYSSSSKSKDLLAAAEKEDIEEAKNLLAKGAYVNTQDSDGVMPLFLAVKKQNYELAELFLSYKADVNKGRKSADLSLLSPLIFALQYDGIEFIKLHLDHGAKLNLPCSEGITPLHLAVKRKDIGIVNALLDRGADVNAESERTPATAIGMAIDQASFDIIIALVEHGSDVNQEVSKKETPVPHTIRKGELNIVKYLLQSGAHVDTHTLQTAMEMSTCDLY